MMVIAARGKCTWKKTTTTQRKPIGHHLLLCIWAAKWWGKYPPLSPTSRWIIVQLFATQIPKKKVSFCQYTEKWSEIKLLMSDDDCSEVNSTCYSLPNKPISMSKKP